MHFDKIVTCDKCGAKYKVFKVSVPMRDKDSIECDICNNTLITWNGGVMYRTELIPTTN